MKPTIIKICTALISAIIICGLTLFSEREASNHSLQDHSYRVIINFDTGLVSNKNLTLAVELLKSEELRNALHSKTVRAVFTSRYLDGKLKPEFKHCEDGGWFLIESNNRNRAKELIALLRHHETIKEIYLEEPTPLWRGCSHPCRCGINK